MNFQEIKRFCNKFERELIALEAERNTLLILKKEHEDKVIEFEKNKELNKKANIFIRQIASETRLNAIASIEEVVTAWSREIYTPDYLFSMDMKEVSHKDSENAGLFTIQPSIEKIVGGALTKRPLKGTSGGGLHEIISLVMRLAFGTYNGYQGFYMYDEALAAVSKDDCLKDLLIFLEKYINELDMQNILITHSPEKFAQISTKNYQIFKEDGIAKAREVSMDDIKEMQNFNVSEKR